MVSVNINFLLKRFVFRFFGTVIQYIAYINLNVLQYPNRKADLSNFMPRNIRRHHAYIYDMDLRRIFLFRVVPQMFTVNNK